MVQCVMPYEVKAYGLSEIGLVRPNNEDYWGSNPGLSFYALADGMGGHRAGEVASKEAVEALCYIIKKTVESSESELSIEEWQAFIQLAFEYVNEIVYNLGRTYSNLRGMGTTLCCLYFHPKGVIYGHVGDSRIYRQRQGHLELLTKDHSLLREMVDLGQIDEKQKTASLYKNVLTQAIGTEPLVEPTVSTSEVQDGDLYFMCTDGLTDLVAFDEIERMINESSDIAQAVDGLVSLALERGGLDNITIVMTKVYEHHETEDLSR